MDIVEKAKLIEDTELDLTQFFETRHKTGLTYFDLAKIQVLQLEILLNQSEAEYYVGIVGKA